MLCNISNVSWNPTHQCDVIPPQLCAMGYKTWNVTVVLKHCEKHMTILQICWSFCNLWEWLASLKSWESTLVAEGGTGGQWDGREGRGGTECAASPVYLWQHGCGSVCLEREPGNFENCPEKSDDNMANFTQGVEEEVRFTVNGKEVVVGKEVGPQTRLARYQWLTWRDILAYGVPAHLTLHRSL